MATEAEPTPSDNSDAAREVLRAKYVEYCSAQLADLLLYLTPDEIYLLAQHGSADPSSAPEAEAQPSYGAMVERATAWLASRVALPPFDVWIEDYRRNPERYEAYLIGLWESDARPAGSAVDG